MAAEGHNKLNGNGFCWPQINANDADRSLRDHPSSRVTTVLRLSAAI
jgi:hypothetical protein